MKDQRSEAVKAASRARRLLAKVEPDKPAKVPVPVAVRAEPTPWEKFSGGRIH